MKSIISTYPIELGYCGSGGIRLRREAMMEAGRLRRCDRARELRRGRGCAVVPPRTMREAAGAGSRRPPPRAA
ncbi:hypothetical protein [Pseudomonas sp. CGJS7]|uniref:hypothetical protein n=1 Tax=Pseudomonas sp. CGJS7 TaxID=3109348 RepID=UPI00300A4445